MIPMKIFSVSTVKDDGTEVPKNIFEKIVLANFLKEKEPGKSVWGLAT